MKSLAAVAFLLLTLPSWSQGPTVFINGDQGVSATSGGFAFGGVAGSSASVKRHDKTSEMAHELLESCPEISLTLDESAHLDYLALLHQEDGYGGGIRSQIMVLRPDKSVIFASKQGRTSHVIKDGCKAIMNDWKNRREPRRTNSDYPQGTWNSSAKP